MNTSDLWVSTFVPFLSASLGGLIALFGVVITIKHEDRQRKRYREEELKVQAKPIIINYSMQQVSEKAIATFPFSKSGEIESGETLTGIFKNTDNGIMFIDKIVSKDITYFPVADSVLDKNMPVRIVVQFADEHEIFHDYVMHVHDIYNNKYYYNLEYNKSELKFSELLVGQIQELKNDH